MGRVKTFPVYGVWRENLDIYTPRQGSFYKNRQANGDPSASWRQPVTSQTPNNRILSSISWQSIANLLPNNPLLVANCMDSCFSPLANRSEIDRRLIGDWFATKYRGFDCKWVDLFAAVFFLMGGGRLVTGILQRFAAHVWMVLSTNAWHSTKADKIVITIVMHASDNMMISSSCAQWPRHHLIDGLVEKRLNSVTQLKLWTWADYTCQQPLESATVMDTEMPLQFVIFFGNTFMLFAVFSAQKLSRRQEVQV